MNVTRVRSMRVKRAPESFKKVLRSRDNRIEEARSVRAVWNTRPSVRIQRESINDARALTQHVFTILFIIYAKLCAASPWIP